MTASNATHPEPRRTSAIDVEAVLVALLEDDAAAFNDALAALHHDDFDAPQVASVQSFRDARLCTRDSGVVLRTSDGAEFQLTIVQSR